MRDTKSEAEEKADKEKRDWRTLDEQVKMNRLCVAAVEKGAGGKRTARLLTREARSVNKFSWAPDGRQSVRAPADAVDRRLALRRPRGRDRRRRHRDVAAAGKVTEDQAIYSPDGRFIAFTVSDNPPSWAFERRVQVSRRPAARRARWPPRRSSAADPRLVERRAQLLVNETIGLAGRITRAPRRRRAAVVLATEGSGPRRR